MIIIIIPMIYYDFFIQLIQLMQFHRGGEKSFEGLEIRKVSKTGTKPMSNFPRFRTQKPCDMPISAQSAEKDFCCERRELRKDTMDFSGPKKLARNRRGKFTDFVLSRYVTCNFMAGLWDLLLAQKTARNPDGTFIDIVLKCHVTCFLVAGLAKRVSITTSQGRSDMKFFWEFNKKSTRNQIKISSISYSKYM